MHTKHALPHKLNKITNGIKLPLLHALQSSIYDSHKPDVWCIFRTFTPNVFLATGLLLRFQAIDLIHINLPSAVTIFETETKIQIFPQNRKESKS